MLLDLQPDHLKMVTEVLRRHIPNVEVRAFGSRVTGAAKKHSDLDLVVMGEKPMDFTVRGSLLDDLSESSLPFRVDVVDWASTEESFRKLITTNSLVIQRPNPGAA